MSNSPDHNENKDVKNIPLFDEFNAVSRKIWEDQISEDLKGADYKKKLSWHTKEGFKVLPFYMRQDVDSLSFTEEIPGSFPFTRGHSDTTSAPSWKIGQQVYGNNLADVNKVAGDAIENGCDALVIPFNLTKTKGKSDQSFKLNGPELLDQSSFNKVFKAPGGNPLLIFDCGNFAPFLTAAYRNMVDEAMSKSGKQPADVQFIWDPLTSMAFADSVSLNTETETWSEPLAQGVRFAEQIAGREDSHVKLLGINAKRYHNAGANAAQEIAFALSIANEYLANLTDAGLSLKTLLKQLFFAFGTGSSYFKEIAKLRAFRFLWAQVISKYGISGDDQPHVPVYSFTSGWNKTLYDPHSNLLRTTTEGMSATIGGCDLLVIQPFDQTFRKPTDFSLHLARNQQHLLKEEAYFDAVQDPGGGSYYIETLTQKLAGQAWDLFVEIEQLGGFAHALEHGFIHEQVEQVRNEQREKLANRKQIRVGINDYPNPDANAYDYISTGQDDAESKTFRLNDAKNSIDANTNIFEILQKKLNNGETLHACLATLYTVGTEPEYALAETTEAREFEELRRQTEQYAAKSESHRRPDVLIAPLGHPKWRAARANFAANLFGIAGYNIHKPVAFTTVDEVVEAYIDKNPDVIVICSSDKEYPDLCQSVSKTLRNSGIASRLVLAGNPGDKKEFYESLEINRFIYKGMDVLGFLEDFQKQLGVEATH